MKKTLLILLFIPVIYSCKKGDTPSTSATTWISGTWKREILNDTVFYSTGAIAGINAFPVNLNAAEVNFNTSNTGTTTIPTYNNFSYSLSTNTLTYGNGAVWKIVQISSTHFKLIMHESAGVGWDDQYVKE